MHRDQMGCPFIPDSINSAPTSICHGWGWRLNVLIDLGMKEQYIGFLEVHWKTWVLYCLIQTCCVMDAHFTLSLWQSLVPSNTGGSIRTTLILPVVRLGFPVIGVGCNSVCNHQGLLWKIIVLLFLFYYPIRRLTIILFHSVRYYSDIRYEPG